MNMKTTAVFAIVLILALCTHEARGLFTGGRRRRRRRGGFTGARRRIRFGFTGGRRRPPIARPPRRPEPPKPIVPVYRPKPLPPFTPPATGTCINRCVASKVNAFIGRWAKPAHGGCGHKAIRVCGAGVTSRQTRCRRVWLTRNCLPAVVRPQCTAQCCKPLGAKWCNAQAKNECGHQRTAGGKAKCVARRYKFCRTRTTCNYQRLKNVCYKLRDGICSTMAALQCRKHRWAHVKAACLKRIAGNCGKLNSCNFVPMKEPCRKMSKKFCQNVCVKYCSHHTIKSARRKCFARRFKRCRSMSSCTYAIEKRICYKTTDAFCGLQAVNGCKVHQHASVRRECEVSAKAKCLKSNSCKYFPKIMEIKCQSMGRNFCATLAKKNCKHQLTKEGQTKCQARRYKWCRTKDSCQWQKLKNICYATQDKFCQNEADSHCKIHVFGHIEKACRARSKNVCLGETSCTYTATKEQLGVKCRKLKPQFCRTLAAKNCKHQLTAAGRAKCMTRRTAHCIRSDSCAYKRLQNICYANEAQFCKAEGVRLCKVHSVPEIRAQCQKKTHKKCLASDSCKYLGTPKQLDVKCRPLQPELCRTIATRGCTHQKTTHGRNKCQSRRFEACRQTDSCAWKRLINKCYDHPKDFCSSEAKQLCSIHKLDDYESSCNKRVTTVCKVRSDSCTYEAAFMGVKCERLTKDYCSKAAKATCAKLHFTSEGRAKCAERRIAHCQTQTSCSDLKLQKKCFANSENYCREDATRRCWQLRGQPKRHNECVARVSSRCQTRDSCNYEECPAPLFDDSSLDNQELVKQPEFSDPVQVPCLVRKPPANLKTGLATVDVAVPWDQFDCDKFIDSFSSMVSSESVEIYIVSYTTAGFFSPGEVRLQVACPDHVIQQQGPILMQNINSGKAETAFGGVHLRAAQGTATAPGALSPFQITGIVVGSVLGAAALLAVALVVGKMVYNKKQRAAAAKGSPLAESESYEILSDGSNF